MTLYWVLRFGHLINHCGEKSLKFEWAKGFWRRVHKEYWVVILQDIQTQTDEFGPLSAWMKHDYSPKVTLF